MSSVDRPAIEVGSGVPGALPAVRALAALRRLPPLETSIVVVAIALLVALSTFGHRAQPAQALD
ncbi:MAG: hypothetical protein GIX03_14750, partial [Candidatus Eremiobacteraeota bacterium]|nr:hypothetical protein [Candidatus Eremiobacteraeota bacterium]